MLWSAEQYKIPVYGFFFSQNTLFSSQHYVSPLYTDYMIYLFHHALQLCLTRVLIFQTSNIHDVIRKNQGVTRLTTATPLRPLLWVYYNVLHFYCTNQPYLLMERCQWTMYITNLAWRVWNIITQNPYLFYLSQYQNLYSIMILLWSNHDNK